MQMHDAKWAERGGGREVNWRTLFGLNISHVREAGFLFWKGLTSYLDKRALTGDVLIPGVKTTPGEFACNYELSQYSRQALLQSSRHSTLDVPSATFKERIPCAGVCIKAAIWDGAAAHIKTTPPTGIGYWHGECFKACEILKMQIIVHTWGRRWCHFMIMRRTTLMFDEMSSSCDKHPVSSCGLQCH